MQSRKSGLPAIIATLVTVLWFAFPGHHAAAQAIDLEGQRQQFTSIAADWRTHPGDDPRWAEPSFDDKGWKLIQPATDWVFQGYAEQNNLAWFRFRLRVPAHSPTLVVELPRIDKSYQLFANGKLIGQAGRLPPETPGNITGSARVFTLPVRPSDSPQQITIALRLWQSPELVGISANVLDGQAYVGTAATVLRQFSLVKAASLLSRGSVYTQDIILLIVGAASLLLFWLTRQGFYMWFALNMVLSASDLPMHLVSQHFAWSFLSALYVYILLDFLVCATLALFVLGALNLQGLRLSIFSVALCLLAEAGPLLVILFRLSLIWADGIYFFFSTTVYVLLFWLLVRGWRAGSVDAKLLLLPYSIGALVATTGNLGH